MFLNLYFLQSQNEKFATIKLVKRFRRSHRFLKTAVEPFGPDGAANVMPVTKTVPGSVVQVDSKCVRQAYTGAHRSQVGH